MEMTTILGLVIGLGGIILGNIIEGGHLGSLAQGAAAMIVLSGTLGAVMVSSRKQDIKLAWKIAKHAFYKNNNNEIKNVANELLECSRLARRESILAIENRLVNMKDQYMQNVMKGVIDGIDPLILRQLFEKQIEFDEENLHSAAKVWTDAGGYSPTIGIIGAVLGLIHVMGNLTDTSKLGGGIAVAFVATIYGVALANLILLPLGSKLKKWAATQTLEKEMILEGALCIQSGLAPALTEQRLKPYLDKAAE